MPWRSESKWEYYIRYEHQKKLLSCWDEGDLLDSKRFRRHGHCGVLIHQAFIDEVQDFTQAELWLYSDWRFPSTSFLAGDTAQTIARGVDSSPTSRLSSMTSDIK